MRSMKRDGSDERRILIGMITDRQVLARIASKWEGELFQSQWSNLVAGWCVTHFKRYGRPPGRAIESRFEEWATKGRDKDTVTLLEQFIGSLSDEYEATDTNADYLIDLAAKHFQRVKLEQLKASLEEHLDAGELDKAAAQVDGFTKVELGEGSWIDPIADEEAVKGVFAEKREPLIKYPGALENFFGNILERDALVAFLAPEKRGKTWWLMDLVWRAVEQGRRVAYFEVGDMSQNQIMRRLLIRASKHPAKAGTIRVPTHIEHEPDTSEAQCSYEDRTFEQPLNSKVALKALRKVVDQRQGLLRLSCHPNSSISVLGLKALLEDWDRRDGWTPDVVALDYADILAPPAGVVDSRDQINMTWKQLRSLSQSRHCLVATATQAKATSYYAELLGIEHFSEDKRKNAHVTAVIGINQLAQEREAGIYRLNLPVVRESDITPDKCVFTAGCLALGNPALKSTF